MTSESREVHVTDALSRHRAGIAVPPIDPDRERALLAAFDAHWTRRRSAEGRWVWITATVGLLAITLALNWLVATAPRVVPEAPAATIDLGEFVTWPGAHTWPPFESGRLVRVDLPVSALPALGLLPPSSAATVVQADIIVAQDGMARAVRLVRSY
jgi:hypothetical protein